MRNLASIYRILFLVLVLATMFLGVYAGLSSVEAAPQTPNYMDDGGGRWNIGGDLVYVPESLVVSSSFITVPATITTTGTFQTLTASGAVTVSSIIGGYPGKVLVLENTSSNTIIISETATIQLGGQRSLGQYDTLKLINDGTNWVELDFSNN